MDFVSSFILTPFFILHGPTLASKINCPFQCSPVFRTALQRTHSSGFTVTMSWSAWRLPNQMPALHCDLYLGCSAATNHRCSHQSSNNGLCMVGLEAQCELSNQRRWAHGICSATMQLVTRPRIRDMVLIEDNSGSLLNVRNQSFALSSAKLVLLLL